MQVHGTHLTNPSTRQQCDSFTQTAITYSNIRSDLTVGAYHNVGTNHTTAADRHSFCNLKTTRGHWPKFELTCRMDIYLDALKNDGKLTNSYGFMNVRTIVVCCS